MSFEKNNPLPSGFTAKLKKAAIAALISSQLIVNLQSCKSDEGSSSHSNRKKAETEKTIEEAPEKKGPIVLSDLQIESRKGRTFISKHNLHHTLSRSTPIMTTALGLEGHTSMPETIELDMAHNLKNLWHKKLIRVWTDKRQKFGTSKKVKWSKEDAEERRKGLQDMEATEGLRVADPCAYYYVKKVRPYVTGDGEKTSLRITDFIASNEKIVGDIKRHINRSAIQDIYNMTDAEMQGMKNIVETIDGQDLTSYCLTELMEDDQNGEFNVRLLDVYLAVGGKEFLQSFPAIYDGWTSHGPFQFTSNALYSKDNQNEGASKMNPCITIENCIPSSIVDMSFEDHTKAALLFGLHNIANLTRKLSPHQIHILNNNITQKGVQNVFIQYIAMAHNNPGGAIKGCRKWIDADCKGDMYKSVTNKSVSNYGKKTKINLRALQRGVTVK